MPPAPLRSPSSQFGLVKILDEGNIYKLSLPATLSDLESWKKTVNYNDPDDGGDAPHKAAGAGWDDSDSYISLHAIRSTLYRIYGCSPEFDAKYNQTVNYLVSVKFQLTLIQYSCLLLKPTITCTLLRFKSLTSLESLKVPRYYGAWIVWNLEWLKLDHHTRYFQSSPGATTPPPPCSCGSPSTLKPLCCSCTICTSCFFSTQKNTDFVSCPCGKSIDKYFLLGLSKENNGCERGEELAGTSLERYNMLPEEVTTKELKKSRKEKVKIEVSKTKAFQGNAGLTNSSR